MSYNVHESIVYAIYTYKHSNIDKKIFGKYRKFMENPEEALEAFNPAQYETFEPIPIIAKSTMSLIN